MLHRQNFSLARGASGAFAIDLSHTSGRTLDISEVDAVQVDVYRLGAWEDEAPVLSCTEGNGRLVKTAESGTTVSVKFLVPADASAAMSKGDYIWKEVDTVDGLVTESIGGVLSIV